MAYPRLRYLLAALAALLLWPPATAQLPRGPRTLVRAGLMDKPDSLKAGRDSLRAVQFYALFDSLAAEDYRADSMAQRSLRTDDIVTLDSVAQARFLLGYTPDDTVPRHVFKKGWFMSDSMGISKVCWLSTFIPGYGQIYNKQYW